MRLREFFDSLDYSTVGTSLQEHLFKGGFFPAQVPVENNWREMNAWCQKRHGDQFTWTGRIFWFETEKDRNWFLLRFG